MVCPVNIHGRHQKFPLKPLPFSNQVFAEEDITHISPESQDFIKKMFDSSLHTNKFFPPGEQPVLLYGYSGGAEWGGNAIDSDGILYQNANNALWKVQMESRLSQEKEFLNAGQGLYTSHCSSCHGTDKKGNGAEIPGLLQIGSRLSETEINHIVADGRRRMPSFSQLSPVERKAITQYLLTGQSVKSVSKKGTE